MSDDDARDAGIEVAVVIGGDAREIGEGTVVGVAHVHATVEHDPLASDRRHQAALPHLLPGPCHTTQDMFHFLASFLNLLPSFSFSCSKYEERFVIGLGVYLRRGIRSPLREEKGEEEESSAGEGIERKSGKGFSFRAVGVFLYFVECSSFGRVGRV